MAPLCSQPSQGSHLPGLKSAVLTPLLSLSHSLIEIITRTEPVLLMWKIHWLLVTSHVSIATTDFIFYWCIYLKKYSVHLVLAVLGFRC